MSATCSPGIECCPPQAFPTFQMPPNIKAQLTGLLWQIPCVRPLEAPYFNEFFVCNADNPTTDVTVLNGNPSFLYDATILIRGVMELMAYTGGNVLAGSGGYINKDGTPAGPASPLYGHNIYKLEISNPPASYFVNNWDGTGDMNAIVAVRAIFPIQVYGGASVTLSADVVNMGQATNWQGIVAPLVAGDPEFRVTQPLASPDPTDTRWGQFAQADCLSIH